LTADKIKQKRSLRIQIIPFFVDMAIYKQALMLANATKIRMTEYVIQALNVYYTQEFKEPLQFKDVSELHDKIAQMAKKRNRNLADTIEVVVKEYNEKKFKEIK
jgi:hypothetical protein